MRRAPPLRTDARPPASRPRPGSTCVPSFAVGSLGVVREIGLPQVVVGADDDQLGVVGVQGADCAAAGGRQDDADTIQTWTPELRPAS